MGGFNMKKAIYFPIIAMAIGEILILYDKVLVGLGIHVANLFGIIIIITFANLKLETKNILQTLILFPLLRTINITTPQLFTNIHLQQILMSGIMLIPMYYIVKSQQISFKKLEKDFDRIYIYIFAIILTWTIGIIVRQYMSIYNVQTFAPAVVSDGGIFTGIFLMVSFPLSLIISDTKYYDKHVSSTFGMCNNSLLMVFVAIVISGVMAIINI